jgi:hypothetical protein
MDYDCFHLIRKGKKPVKSVGWRVLLLTITALLAMGCRASGSQIPTGEACEPFSARRESEDGAIVAWSGCTEGYEPGAEAEFDITIKNETDQSWRGRYCLHMLDRQLPEVIATLEQRQFTLEPGMGFSDTITVRFSEVLGEGAYGLSLAVRRPGGSMVDLVPIRIGETSGVRRAATQQDMDASLESCTTLAGDDTALATSLVSLAKADLAQRLGLSAGQIKVLNVAPAEFPDASLGVPDPGKVYAQVATPGYVIELTADGQTYRYHASRERVLAAPDEVGQPSSDRITIEGVQVSDAQVVIRGTSTLPDGTCVSTELWADGAPLTWWPAEACAPIRQRAWELGFPLEAGQALQPGVQYVVRAFQPGGPDIVATFPFDLDGPATPPSQTPGGDPALVLPDTAEVLGQASADLDGDGTVEMVFLAGFGGAPERLGYDFLQMLVIAPLESGEYRVVWESEQLPTDRAEPLQMQDLNGDGLPEVLSVQAMGASGETLYLLGWQDHGYGWLAPHGGQFDGQDAFGENGVRVEDTDGDGLAEILASYGPAAALTDVYGWDGQAYVYRQILGW